jgi:hypothetical protein
MLSRSERLKQLGFPSYNVYLISPHWINYRIACLRQPGRNRCAVCQSRRLLQLHHRTYVRIGDERYSDTVTLCKQHHADLHAWLILHSKSITNTDEAIARLIETRETLPDPTFAREQRRFQRNLARFEQLVTNGTITPPPGFIAAVSTHHQIRRMLKKTPDARRKRLKIRKRRRQR